MRPSVSDQITVDRGRLDFPRHWAAIVKERNDANVECLQGPSVATSGKHQGQRPPATEARMNGPTDPFTVVRLSLYARQNHATFIERARITAKITHEFPKQRDYLSADAFASIFGAAHDDLPVSSTWAERKGFKILDADAASRRISVEATARMIN